MNKRTWRLMTQLLGKNKWLFVGAAACTVLSVAMDYLTPLLLAETLDYYLSDKASTMPALINRWVDALGGPAFMARNLWLVGLILVAVNVLGGVFSYGKARLQSMAGENVALDLRERLYHHIQHLPFSYHVKAETGDLIQRCTSDVDTVRKTLSNQLMAIFWSVTMVVVALSVLFAKDWRLALLSMIMVPALFLFAYMFFGWVHKSFTKADEAEGKMSAVLQENLTGVRVVRAFGQQQYEVIIANANDATVALAECLAGSEESFVSLMNAKASSLCLTNTHYVNCTGLSAEGQYSSAYDIAIIASQLCRFPTYSEYGSLWISTLVHPSGRVTDLTNTNRLVRFYESCDGMKTGSSGEAKYCICATAKNDNLRLITVCLGASSSQTRFDEAKAMLEYGLGNYKRTTVIEHGELTGYTLPILRGARDRIDIAAGKGLSLLLRSGQEKQLSVELSLPENLMAPLSKDHVIGEIRVHLNQQPIAVLPAVPADDVRLPGYFEGFIRILANWR